MLSDEFCFYSTSAKEFTAVKDKRSEIYKLTVLAKSYALDEAEKMKSASKSMIMKETTGVASYLHYFVVSPNFSVSSNGLQEDIDSIY